MDKKVTNFFLPIECPYGDLQNIFSNFVPSITIEATIGGVKMLKIGPLATPKSKLGAQGPLGPPRIKPNMVNKLPHDTNHHHT